MKANRLLLLLSVTCAATALAVDPPPDGGYPDQNTAEGEDSLFNLTTGVGNTAIGFHALYGNTIGTGNTALGVSALVLNSTGFYNTATGNSALLSNTVGNFNTATGNVALALNTSGRNNTAVGYGALYNNTTGNNNLASGRDSLSGNTTGRNNTAIGQGALLRNATGSFNIGIGSSAGSKLTTGSNNIDIFDRGVAEESNTIRIGTKGSQTSTSVAGISGVTVAAGVGVVIDATGHLGTMVSSARFKDNIKPMEKSSEAILNLKPVTFRYKKELDAKAIPQFGLVAEDVTKVDPDLVARDEEGKPYSVRYEAVNAMLLNEFLKEHRKVEELQATVEEMKETLEQVSARLKATNP